MAQIKVRNTPPSPPSLLLPPPVPLTLPNASKRRPPVLQLSSPILPLPPSPLTPPSPQMYPAWKKNMGRWIPFTCRNKPRRVSVSDDAILVHLWAGKKQHPKSIKFSQLTSINLTLEEEFLPLADDRARSASAGVAKVVVGRKDGPDFVLTMDGDAAKSFVEDVTTRFQPATPPVTPPPSPPRVAGDAVDAALPPILVGPIEPVVEQAPVLPPAAPAVVPALPLTEPHHTLVQGGEEGQNWKGLILILSILAFLQTGLALFTSSVVGSIGSACSIMTSILNAPLVLLKALPSLLPAPAAGTTTMAALLSLLGEHRLVFFILGGMGLSAIISFVIHALAEKNDKRPSSSSWMRGLAAPVAGLLAFIHACFLTYQIVSYPGPQLIKLGLTLLLLTLILKQWTFVATSAEFRLKAFVTGQLSSSSSPSGVTWWSYIYSLFAPTLIYQPSYPRAASIDWMRVLGLVVQLLIILMISGVLVQEWICPLLEMHKHAIATLNVPEIILATLRLSVPSTLVWLMLIGYGLFFVHLNLVAELTCFGDRLFCKDWWNARTLRCYWSSWNLPVSCFLRRHVLHVLKRVGSPVKLSMLTVFFISALLHEVAVAVPFGTYQGYRGLCGMYGPFALLGMLAQVPAILMTDRYKHQPQWVGNFIFWLQFCVVGQPLAVLLYYHEVVVYLPQLVAGAAGMA